MSHTVSIKVEFAPDLKVLRAACESLGWTLLEGKATYRWYGRFMEDYPLPEGVKASDLGKCLHAIKVPGAAYEIGLVQTASGNLKPVWDFWNQGSRAGGLSSDTGETLAAAYAVCAAEQAAQDQGWLTERDGEALLIHHPSGGTLRVERKGIDASQFTGGQCLDAILALGLPIDQATAKPEFNQAPVAVSLTK